MLNSSLEYLISVEDCAPSLRILLHTVIETKSGRLLSVLYHLKVQESMQMTGNVWRNNHSLFIQMKLWKLQVIFCYSLSHLSGNTIQIWAGTDWLHKRIVKSTKTIATTDDFISGKAQLWKDFKHKKEKKSRRNVKDTKKTMALWQLECVPDAI